MAMQTGVSFSKILILAGAGYTGTILLNNGKVSDILGELQSLVKGLEKTGEQADDSDALLAQVRRLSTEIRQLASARQITVLNGDSGDALSAAKKHLTQRIQNLDDKMETQKQISKSIQASVEDARMNLSNIEYDLDALQRMISGLDGKIGSLEYKQDLANAGVWYLCNMVGGKKANMPEALQEQLKLSGKSHALLTSGTPTPKGLKGFADILSGSKKDSGRDAIVKDGIDNLDEEPRSLHRSISARC